MSAESERRPRAVAPVAGAELAKRLRDATPDILAEFLPMPPLSVDWRFSTRDETIMEWNRSELGPSTELVWTMVPGVINAVAEAVVRHDIIRWSSVDVHRIEVLGHWRVGPRAASLFARAEGDAPITEVRCDSIVWRSVWGMGRPLPIR